jgi:hypothetical protein
MARMESVSSFLLNKEEISFIDDDLDFRREVNHDQVTVREDELFMMMMTTTTTTAMVH